jgi:hypothetical protein
MNYDFNNLEEMLRSGVSAEDIAQYFTKNLNEAIDSTKRDSKRAELYENLADSWNEVLRDWADNHEMPDGVSIKDLELDGPHTEEIMGQFMDLVASLAPLYKAFANAADRLLANKGPESAPVQKNTAPRGCQCKKDPEDMPDEDFDALMRVFLDSIGAN